MAANFSSVPPAPAPHLLKTSPPARHAHRRSDRPGPLLRNATGTACGAGGFACQGPIANRPQDTILPHTASFLSRMGTQPRADRSLIVTPKGVLKGLGFHSRRRPRRLWKNARPVAIGDGGWQRKKASRHPADTNTAPGQMMSDHRASTAGCALFPERILRCRLVLRLYYKAFAETRPCLPVNPIRWR